MIVLGIHDGHNSGASLLRDGAIVASVSEERLTRRKNEIGFPRLAIAEVLRLGRCSPSEIDSVAYASNFMHSADHLRKAGEWYRAGLEEQRIENARADSYLKAIFDIRRSERIAQVVELLGVQAERITFVEHHLAHAAAAYYGSPFAFDEPTLVLTCDGAGDGLSATVSVGVGGRLERIAATRREASLGKIYSRVTYALGLTPWEHEYKVMGLAPYADPQRARAVSDVFRQLVVLGDDRLTFKVAGEIQSSFAYKFLRDALDRVRFDEVSGGAQLYTEEMLCSWASACVAKTGIRRLACGGGVFMNVKANLRIAQLPDVDQIFVFPSCGDESLSFGAAWHEYYARAGATPDKVPMTDICLGAAFSEGEVTAALDAGLSRVDCTVERLERAEESIAERLAANQVVARFAGRMEWGARALGNRSILANPREWRNVERINSMIKMRDFWMPFAPSIMAESQARYLRNPKSIASPFMMFAYETTALASEHISAAIHPRDRTARAQFVDRSRHPEYWALLKAFEDRTGQSAVLNTSFNLHGFPLVNTPAEALDVFLRSGLDCLVLGKVMVSKPAAAAIAG